MGVQEQEQLWGGETTKAVANFPVSGERIPVPVVRWLGRIVVLQPVDRHWRDAALLERRLDFVRAPVGLGWVHGRVDLERHHRSEQHSHALSFLFRQQEEVALQPARTRAIAAMLLACRDNRFLDLAG